MGKTYTDIAARLPEYKEMAKLVYMSQMIAGIKDADMAFMVLVECEVTGQTLFQWAEENHIVGTRPTMKYDAMIAAYNQLQNCKFEFIEKSPERCAIALTDGGTRKEFSLAWTELQKESVPYVGKEGDIVAKLAKGETPALKDKYATPRSRAVMMYARLVSDAIRSTRPEVTKGRYTPEEVEDFDPTVTVDAPPAKTARVMDLPAEQKAVATIAKADAPAAEPTEDQATNSLVGKTSISLDAPAMTEQVESIKAKLAELKKGGLDVIASVKAKLASSGVNGLAGMSVGEADSLMRALDNKMITAWVEGVVKGPSPS